MGTKKTPKQAGTTLSEFLKNPSWTNVQINFNPPNSLVGLICWSMRQLLFVTATNKPTQAIKGVDFSGFFKKFYQLRQQRTIRE